jgi:aldose 1-epimerase
LCLDSYIPNSKVATYVGKAVAIDTAINLKIYTSMPGMQIFTANHFVNKKGKNNTHYQAQQGVCFETQFYPDTPNQPYFPSAILEKNESFYAITVYEVLF